VLEQQEILDFVQVVFEDREKLSFEEYASFNKNQSSEMLFSVLHFSEAYLLDYGSSLDKTPLQSKLLPHEAQFLEAISSSQPRPQITRFTH